MITVEFVAVALLAAILMEPAGGAIHRYLGHGVLWPVHRSHHEGEVKGPELNDLIPAVSAALTIAAFAAGVYTPGLWWLAAIAAGSTLYGALYFVLHDIYIHRRLPLLPEHIAFLEPFKQAHLHHHRTGVDHWGILSRLPNPVPEPSS